MWNYARTSCVSQIPREKVDVGLFNTDEYLVGGAGRGRRICH